MYTRRCAANLIGGAILTLSLTACQPLSASFIDRYYDSADTIVLQNKQEQTNTWKTFEMTVHYRYQLTDTLDVSGTATLGNHYQDLYERLTELKLYLFLLDDDTKVLATRKIGQEFNTDTDTVVRFSETIPLVAGTTRIAFGYEGKVMASDPEQTGGDWFYKLPLSTKP